MGANARGLAAIRAVNVHLAVIDAAERQPGISTGVRVKAAAPELTGEQRARVERLLLTTGF